MTDQVTQDRIDALVSDLKEARDLISVLIETPNEFESEWDIAARDWLQRQEK